MALKECWNIHFDLLVSQRGNFFNGSNHDVWWLRSAFLVNDKWDDLIIGTICGAMQESEGVERGAKY